MHAVQVTIGLPPERLGGTEVYVASLIDALAVQGCTSDVVYLQQVSTGSLRRVEVRRRESRVVRVEVPRDLLPLERLLNDDPVRRRVAGALLEACLDLRPDVLHLHPLTIAIESELVCDVRLRAPVVLTYHTGIASCLRGDLLLEGRSLCDGAVELLRCRACSLGARGLPRALVPLVSGLASTGWRPRRSGPIRRLSSALELARQPAGQLRAWERLRRGVQAFVAGSRWVQELLLRNGVAPERVVLSPHGTSTMPTRVSPRTGALRLGFVGRFRVEKGAGLLLDALERVPPDADVLIEVVSPTWQRPAQEELAIVARARGLAARDPRLRLAEAVPPDGVAARMADWDALLVPSLAPETGPLVVLEAQAAGLPIIGSRRAGIAERVSDGRSGFLLEPGDVVAWAELIKACARTPQRLRDLRQHVPQPRPASAVATDMLALYERLLGERSR